MISSIVPTVVLCAIPSWATALISIGTLVAGGFLGYFFYRLFVNKKFSSAREEAQRILEEGRLEAKTLRKEALLEAKEEQHRMRSELEKETRERRSELQRAEQRLTSRDEQLNKKEEFLDRKIQEIDKSKAQLEQKELDIIKRDNDVKNKEELMARELERVSGMTRDEAKNILMEGLLDSVKKDSAQLAKDIEAKARDEAEKKAKEIIGLAVQKCAADHASEIAVSVVALPNDEMKGRIIGRVGRNIRALENATGVDVIIDDTPDVVTLSGFDPIRREVARITLERLIADGRIHPARIEEMVDKIKNEIDNQIKDAGEAAAFEASVFGLHPEMVKILGRLKYRTSYGQNVLKHSLEVSHLAGIIAAELGADIKIAKRAGLLHDIGKAVDHELEGTHISIGVDIAKKFKESNAVIHAIAAHHGDIEATTLEAMIVQASDAISGARPGARRESIENYVKRLENIEKIANSFEGVEQSFAIQAGREIRVMVKPEEVDDSKTYFIAKEIAKKLESELEYPGQIKVSVIRELRSVEYAK
ncbi:MAG: ribonuclease Y [Clostridia bacterium]|nr:ribonuclease Y [Clostridia bacterium]